MKFHVVPLTAEESRQIPPISMALSDRVQPALLVYGATPTPPIILFCDVLAGEFPGEEGKQVYLLNDLAWAACAGLNLKSSRTIDHTEIPKRYGLLLGPSSACSGERKF